MEENPFTGVPPIAFHFESHLTFLYIPNPTFSTLPDLTRAETIMAPTEEALTARTLMRASVRSDGLYPADGTFARIEQSADVSAAYLSPFEGGLRQSVRGTEGPLEIAEGEQEEQRPCR